MSEQIAGPEVSSEPAEDVARPTDLAKLDPEPLREERPVERRATTVEVRNVNLFYGDFHAVQDVNMTIEPNKVTALIGSSGCGKTTFLRSLNRMHELTPGASAEGQITLDGHDIYDPRID